MSGQRVVPKWRATESSVRLWSASLCRESRANSFASSRLLSISSSRCNNNSPHASPANDDTLHRSCPPPIADLDHLARPFTPPPAGSASIPPWAIPLAHSGAHVRRQNRWTWNLALWHEVPLARGPEFSERNDATPSTKQPVACLRDLATVDASVGGIWATRTGGFSRSSRYCSTPLQRPPYLPPAKLTSAPAASSAVTDELRPVGRLSTAVHCSRRRAYATCACSAARRAGQQRLGGACRQVRLRAGGGRDLRRRFGARVEQLLDHASDTAAAACMAVPYKPRSRR